MALLSFLHFLLLKSNIVSKYYFSWVEVPIPNINVLFTHSYFNWLFIQAEVCKYTSMSWSYWAFSPLCSAHSCRVYMLISLYLYAQLQYSLPLVKTRRGLRKPKLACYLLHHRFFFDLQQRAE